MVVDVNDVFWTWLLIPLVIAAGLYFSARTGRVRLRLFPKMLRTLTEKNPPGADGSKPVSAFGAFTISAAARVNTSRTTLSALRRSWFEPVLGVGLVLLLGMTIFGGVQRIAQVTEVLVPVMAVVYLLLGIAVVLLNIGDLQLRPIQYRVPDQAGTGPARIPNPGAGGGFRRCAGRNPVYTHRPEIADPTGFECWDPSPSTVTR